MICLLDFPLALYFLSLSVRSVSVVVFLASPIITSSDTMRFPAVFPHPFSRQSSKVALRRYIIISAFFLNVAASVLKGSGRSDSLEGSLRTFSFVVCEMAAFC